MPNNFLIVYRAMPSLRLLINRQECTTIQQYLSIISSQISSPNTLPEIKSCSFLELVKERFRNYFTKNVCNIMKKTWEGINSFISHKKVTKLFVLSALIIILLLIKWKFQISLINIQLLSDLNQHLRYRTPNALLLIIT